MVLRIPNPGAPPLVCSVCGQTLKNDWFAQIREGDEWKFFCDPTCVFSHLKSAGHSIGMTPALSRPRKDSPFRNMSF
jgi:hypothetical protein